jgi:two-component system, cell cycle response regulator
VSDPDEATRDVLGEEAFRHLLAWETSRATRYQHFFSVCLVKPDSLEATNSRATEIQLAIARKIAESLRSSDVVARVQDGTAILLLYAASIDARRVAERIRTDIEKVAFPGPSGNPARRLTLSVGKVSFPRDGSTHKTLLSRAQANLHEAARRGGNRVVNAEDSPR